MKLALASVTVAFATCGSSTVDDDVTSLLQVTQSVAKAQTRKTTCLSSFQSCLWQCSDPAKDEAEQTLCVKDSVPSLATWVEVQIEALSQEETPMSEAYSPCTTQQFTSCLMQCTMQATQKFSDKEPAFQSFVTLCVKQSIPALATWVEAQIGASSQGEAPTTEAEVAALHANLTASQEEVATLQAQIEALSAPAPPQKNKYFKAEGMNGDWGGQCTCPDGRTYIVSDNGDSCGSLQCDGGIETVPCERVSKPFRAGLKVECASSENNYFQVEGVTAKWGGQCTCPNGQQYDVSDNGDSCGSLQCHGGMAGPCERVSKPSRSGFKVQCAPDS